MNKTLYITYLFFSLFFLQVVILNNVLLFGFVNPYVYIAFVFLYPLRENRFPFLTLSFLLGLLVDIFLDSGGIHAFSTLFIAFIRLIFVQIIFKKLPSDYQLFSLNQETFGKVFNFVLILTIIHHFLLFSLANFSFQNIGNIILYTIATSAFTLIIFFIGNTLFSSIKK